MKSSESAMGRVNQAVPAFGKSPGAFHLVRNGSNSQKELRLQAESKPEVGQNP